MITATTEKHTTTCETTREFDKNGNVTYELLTETVEVPVPCGYTVTDALEDEDEAELYDAELEIGMPTFQDLIMGAAGIASLIASLCLIVKVVRDK